MKVQGTITRFSDRVGYGFILPDSTRVPAFIHVNDVQGRKLLREGDRLEFELEQNARGLRAVNAVLLNDQGGAL